MQYPAHPVKYPILNYISAVGGILWFYVPLVSQIQYSLTTGSKYARIKDAEVSLFVLCYFSVYLQVNTSHVLNVKSTIWGLVYQGMFNIWSVYIGILHQRLRFRDSFPDMLMGNISLQGKRRIRSSKATVLASFLVHLTLGSLCYFIKSWCFPWRCLCVRAGSVVNHLCKSLECAWGTFITEKWYVPGRRL